MSKVVSMEDLARVIGTLDEGFPVQVDATMLPANDTEKPAGLWDGIVMDPVLYNRFVPDTD